MINWDKINKKISVNKVILPILVIIILLLILVYSRIIYIHIEKNKFGTEMQRISDKNEKKVFTIDKIYLCSSANAISQNDKLKNLELYQYTDIGIYINNYNSTDKVTNENTIKKLYIDEISLEPEENGIGKRALNYINPSTIGKREQQFNEESGERIDFKIINNNEENEKADYSKPTFYADCSNPITLKYVNNLQKTYIRNNKKSITFDGTVLKEAGITTANINCKIKLKINIINNNDENYSCLIDFDIPLDDIYKGTTIKSNTLTSEQYKFFTM